MDLLVLGANGLLGSTVVAEAVERGDSVTAAYHTSPPELHVETVQFDITDTDRFEAIYSGVSPNAIVNCAAMTDVDACEEAPDAAAEVNGRAPGRLAERIGDDSAFVQVSTDYVFDGGSKSKYGEHDETNPVQAYGESKLLGERTVTETTPSALVPRLSFVYGRHVGTGELDGFPAWVKGRLDRGEPVPAFVDQHVTPTRAGQAAETILDLLAAGEQGTFHVAARSCASPFEIAELVAELDDADSDLIEQEGMSDVERFAERPAYTCLDVGRVESTLGRTQPSIETDLEAVL